MTESEKIDKVKELIGLGRIEEAFEIALGFLPQVNRRIENQIIILSSRFHNYKHNLNSGLISYEQNQELNKISVSFLELLSSAEKDIQEEIKRPKNALDVVFKIKPLDGFQKKIVEAKAYYEGGIKFKIILQNTTTENLSIEKIPFEIQFSEEDTVKNQPSLAEMKFGNPVVPQQLFLSLHGSNFKGSWITNINGAQRKKVIIPKFNDLLKTNEAFSLFLKPNEIEIIKGAIKVTEKGSYKISFSFQYELSSNNLEDYSSVVTPQINIVK